MRKLYFIGFGAVLGLVLSACTGVQTSDVWGYWVAPSTTITSPDQLTFLGAPLQVLAQPTGDDDYTRTSDIGTNIVYEWDDPYQVYGLVSSDTYGEQADVEVTLGATSTLTEVEDVYVGTVLVLSEAVSSTETNWFYVGNQPTISTSVAYAVWTPMTFSGTY